MVLLQDFVGGGVVRLVHYAVAVQVGEGDTGIAEVVFYGVLVAASGFQWTEPGPAGERITEARLLFISFL